MKWAIRVMLLAMGTFGLFVDANRTASAQERRKHVLEDAATGDLRPAKITLQPSPSAAPVTKTMPFFSGGVLNAVRAALRRGPDRYEEDL